MSLPEQTAPLERATDAAASAGAAVRLPWPLQDAAERAVREFLLAEGGRGVDFSRPAGEPAFAPPDSVSWRIFKNAVAVFVGGVAAVVLELAEPRVRTGVWEHTSFRVDPRARLQRTGLAAMITVYGGRSVAEATIARVRAMHAHIEGVTPDGTPYAANDPNLLDWVQGSAAYGFGQAYHAYVRPLTGDAWDRLLTEGQEAARLYGATGAPGSRASLDALFDRVRPSLERSAIVPEFLAILREAPLLPAAARLLQPPLIKAAVAIVPEWARRIVGLGPAWAPSVTDLALVRLAAGAAERIAIDTSPAGRACVRMGLPADWLWRR